MNVNDINKNVVDDKLKYEDFKNLLFDRTCMRHEMNKIPSKNDNIGAYIVNKEFVCLVTMTKNIDLKMDSIGFQVFTLS